MAHFSETDNLSNERKIAAIDHILDQSLLPLGSRWENESASSGVWVQEQTAFLPIRVKESGPDRRQKFLELAAFSIAGYFSLDLVFPVRGAILSKATSFRNCLCAASLYRAKASAGSVEWPR